MVLQVPDRAQDNHNGGHQVADQPPLEAVNGCLDVASELRSECGKVGLRRQLLVGRRAITVGSVFRGRWSPLFLRKTAQGAVLEAFGARPRRGSRASDARRARQHSEAGKRRLCSRAFRRRIDARSVVTLRAGTGWDMWLDPSGC